MQARSHITRRGIVIVCTHEMYGLEQKNIIALFQKKTHTLQKSATNSIVRIATHGLGHRLHHRFHHHFERYVVFVSKLNVLNIIASVSFPIPNIR